MFFFKEESEIPNASKQLLSNTSDMCPTEIFPKNEWVISMRVKQEVIPFLSYMTVDCTEKYIHIGGNA